METLYNGIVIPDDFLSKEATTDAPYLKKPPEIIDVTVGRQLFVDNFLYCETSLKPEYHKAVKFNGNPVLFPETPWEKDEASPVACPKSGGVWYDEEERIFKMWYESGWLYQMAYATSKDGVHWERPNLGLEPGTNKILLYQGFEQDKLQRDLSYLRPDSTTVFIDTDTKDYNQRYKLYLRNPGGKYPGIVATSSDGIRWENLRFGSEVYDRSTMFYNPFRKKWIYSIRDIWNNRSRSYRECDDYLDGAVWSADEQHKWLACDESDKSNPYIGFTPQLYNVDAVGYESLMLGMFQIMYGPENNICEAAGVPKITELIPMYSRDGYNFTRPSRESIINASMYKGAWDRGYVQSVGGVTIINGDELWIYYAGFGGDENYNKTNWFTNGIYRNGATGLAKLRRDGFVSMNGNGYIMSRLIKFADRNSMYMNINGYVQVQIFSVDGEIITESTVINANSTDVKLDFGEFDLSSLNNIPFRIKFNIDGEIYSFRFADSKGNSHGARAAGIVKNI